MTNTLAGITAFEIPCVDRDGNGKVDIDFCVAWKVPGRDNQGNPVPSTEKCGDGALPPDDYDEYLLRLDTVPANPAKCKCQTVNTSKFDCVARWFLCHLPQPLISSICLVIVTFTDIMIASKCSRWSTVCKAGVALFLTLFTPSSSSFAATTTTTTSTTTSTTSTVRNETKLEITSCDVEFHHLD